METTNQNSDVFKEVLKEFRPILIIYFPHYYSEGSNFFRIEALKNKIGEALKDKYILMAIPHQEDDFKLDLLSVIKSKFINDRDLETHIAKLQDTIIKNEKKFVKKSENLSQYEEMAAMITKLNESNGRAKGRK